MENEPEKPIWRQPKRSSSPLPDFYHTTDAINQEVHELGKTCHGLIVENYKDGDRFIKVARYMAPEVEKPNFKTMVVAGEHAREMIGPEIALNFVKALCGEAKEQNLFVDIEEAKKETELIVVLNANPGSRQAVEKGEFCTRANPSHVDINRNFDFEYNTTDRNDADTNPGENAFDQPESRILKYLINKHKPHAFLDIHSGFRGMFFPNGVAGDPELGTKLQRMTADVDEAACQCPLGIANKEIGYHTAGSALDYSFSVMKVPFAMAMEVYIDQSATQEIDALETRWNSQKKDLLKPIMTGSSFMQNGISPNTKIPMSFIETTDKDSLASQMTPDACLAYFNPTTQDSYRHTVNTWTNAVASLSTKSRQIPRNAAIEAERVKVKAMIATKKAAVVKEQQEKKARKGPDRAITKAGRHTFIPPVGLHDSQQDQPGSFAQITQEPTEGESPMWTAAKVLGLLFIVYIAIKYYKVKQSKAAEAAPFAPQTSPVQISD